MPTIAIHNATLPSNALSDSQPVLPSHPDLKDFVVGSIEIANRRIAGLNPEITAPHQPALDATDCFVLPGFIDLHVHGGAGSDTMDATPDALAAMSCFFAQHGVSAFAPTTMTGPHVDILRAIEAVALHMKKIRAGARILGVHVEGPYISRRFPGAQPFAYVRKPNLSEFAQLLAAGPLRMITLAPEEPGAEELITLARQHNVVVAMGHTNATYEESLRAVAWGVNQATHTYNAMTGLHHRKPGVLGAVLTNEAIYAQLIADKIHVHPVAMQVLARCKGAERTILITDAIRAAGLPPGQYDLGGQPVTVANNECRLADGTLAGSVATMEQCLANFMEVSGLSLAAAWPAASRTPAASLGLAHEMGSIALGYRADLVLLDQALQVVATLVDGQVVYLREPGRFRR